MKKIKSIVLCCLLTLSFGVANAEGFFSNTYIGLGLGQSSDKDSTSLTSTQSYDDKDTAWKLFYGVAFHKHFALELEYNDFGEYSLTDTADQTTNKVELNSVGLSAVVKGMVTPRIQLFGKLGMHRWNADYTFQTTTTATDLKGTDLFGGVGANFYLGRSFFARLEYENFKFDKDDVDTDSDLITASLIYKF